MSILDLAAASAYAIILPPCVIAAIAAQRTSRPAGEFVTWLAGATYFAALIPLRLLQGEEALRTSLRELLHDRAQYSDRGDFQLVLGIAGILLLAGLLFAGFRIMRYNSSFRAQSTALMRIVIAVSIALYALRIASWHMTDQLLYQGPVRLNWIAEAAIIAAAIAAPARYVWLSRLAARQR